MGCRIIDRYGRSGDGDDEQVRQGRGPALQADAPASECAGTVGNCVEPAINASVNDDDRRVSLASEAPMPRLNPTSPGRPKKPVPEAGRITIRSTTSYQPVSQNHAQASWLRRTATDALSHDLLPESSAKRTHHGPCRLPRPDLGDPVNSGAAAARPASGPCTKIDGRPRSRHRQDMSSPTSSPDEREIPADRQELHEIERCRDHRSHIGVRADRSRAVVTEGRRVARPAAAQSTPASPGTRA
jgi:hypothetical protein